MSSKSLHLTLDDKFFDSFVDMIKKYDDVSNHDFMVYNLSKDIDFKHIKSKHVKHFDFNNIPTNILGYKRIFIHYLDPCLYNLLKITPHDVKIYWVVYGNDMFIPQIFNLNSLFDNQSKNFIKNNKNNLSKYLPYKIWELLLLIKGSKSFIEKKNALKRIDYILHYNYFDYTFLKQKYNFKAKFLKFNYTGIRSIIYKKPDLIPFDKFGIKSNDKIVIVGNSANPTNNHLSLIPALKSLMVLNNFKIVCFLSYGQSKYANYVIKEYRKEFGDNFVPILAFLTKQEYFSLLFQADVTIMNNYRSQGAGIILSLLYYGKKVYMSNKSLLYQFYLFNGIRIFSIEDHLKNSPKDIFNHLSKKVAEDNKMLVKDIFWNEDKLRINIENIMFS